MIRSILIALLFASATRADISFSSLLQEMTERKVVTHWPDHNYRSLQASSYNRAAKTPDDANGWFANGDCNFVIRKENNNGRTESVLMEHDGPGVLTRIWTPAFYRSMGDLKGTDIRIYIDGETTPRIHCNMIDLVTGRGMVKPPFAQTTCRAGVLYLPIPFQKSCKITREGQSFFYIINYRAYEPGTAVESFRPGMLEQHAELLETTGRELLRPTNFNGGKSITMHKEIAAGQAETIMLPAGAPAAIRHLEIKLEASDLPRALRSTVLEMSCDGEETIWCPVGDFFSNVNGIDPAHRMWERETRADGTMICRWIMPYQKSAALRIHNLAKTPVAVKLSAVVSPWEWTENSLYFHTHWWTGDPLPPRPVSDLNFIDVQGRGIHVGDTLVVLNPLWSWWGEGDEKIHVDGDIERKFPSQFGTGSEDYYGWAGGVVPTRADEFSAPFVANVRVGGETRDWPKGKEPYTHGYNICTRTRSLDVTPFARRFKFDMEAFNMIGTPDAFLQYALVTHWYGAPGATHNRQALPGAAALPVPQTEDVIAFTREALAKRPGIRQIKGAIELEDLKEFTLSPGLRGGPQELGAKYAPQQWSNGSHFFVQAGKTGESATFTFTEQYAPRRVIVYPTTSYDYGIVKFSINGKPVKTDWDGYSASPKTGNAIDLSLQQPDGNVIRLSVEVAGKHPESKGYYFGLDAVVLEDPKAAE